MPYRLHLALKNTKGKLPADMPVVSLLHKKHGIIHGRNKMIHETAGHCTHFLNGKLFNVTTFQCIDCCLALSLHLS